VTSPAAAALEPRRARGGAALTLGLVAVGVATSALAWWTNGHLGATLAPALLAGLGLAAWAVPLRWSATAIVFLMLAVDDYSNAMGAWHTPWAIVSELLAWNIDRTIPAARGLKLTGFELAVAFLLVVSLVRRARGSRIDAAGQVQTASVVAEFVVVYLLAVLYGVAVGLARGGSTEIAIWQSRPLIHLALFFFLFHAAYRGSQDLALLGRVVVAAALAKAALAVYVRQTVTIPGRELNAATVHGDSILFALACVVLLAHFMERTDRRRLAACALLVPPILLGMQANNRRLVWVQLGFSLAAIYLLSPWRAWKRFVARAAIVTAPVVALYVAVGWNSPSGVFAPVRIVRSVTESKRDRSTFFRHVENWNLVVNMDDHPILGRGFGHEFIEFYRNDEISSFFPQYLAEPHNQLLALLLFAGLVGFIGIWSLFAVGAFLAARAYRMATRPEDRAAALACFATIIVCHIQTYGDLGPYLTQYKILLALALVVAGKLAVASGAWPVRVPRRPRWTALSPGGSVRL